MYEPFTLSPVEFCSDDRDDVLVLLLVWLSNWLVLFTWKHFLSAQTTMPSFSQVSCDQNRDLCIHAFAFKCSHVQSKHPQPYTHQHAYIYTHIYKYKHTYVHTNAYTYVCIHAPPVISVFLISVVTCTQAYYVIFFYSIPDSFSLLFPRSQTHALTSTIVLSQLQIPSNIFHVSPTALPPLPNTLTYTHP